MVSALAGLPEGTSFSHQIRFAPGRPGHGMIGSGLCVINPPWGFEAEAQRLDRLLSPLLKP
jgi:23S rRNA (adenine2030-N6)-methyltransferase